jgi:hypothetical protein
MWIPYHVGLVGNELVDEQARHAALEGSIFDITIFSSDFQNLASPALIRAVSGRFAHYIFADVTLRPWYEGQKEETRFVCTQGFYLEIALFDRILVDFE